MNTKAGNEIKYVFSVFVALAPVVGLTNTDFVKYVYKNGVASAVAVVVSEIGSGHYVASYTPDSVGVWFVGVRRATMELAFESVFIVNSVDIDDMLIPLGTSMVTISVEDQDADPVENVEISIQNETQTVIFGVVKTLQSGSVIFGLNPGTYQLVPFKKLHDFSGTPYELVVSGATTTDTIVAQRNLIRSPSSPNKCVLWGYTVNASGDPIKNSEVHAYPLDIVSSDNDVIDNKRRSTRSNNSGFFQIELTQTQRVRIEIPASSLSKTFAVPAVTNKELTTIA